MRHLVHILASLRDWGLLPASLLVFDTIRKGFPSSEILVHMNYAVVGDARRSDEFFQAVTDKCDKIKAVCAVAGGGEYHDSLNHFEWISKLIQHERYPFFICDTDMVFHGNLEGLDFHGPLHGRLIPEFTCPFSGAVTQERLHTSLLYIEPLRIRVERNKWSNRTGKLHPFHVPTSLIHPSFFIKDGVPLFHDTMGMAYSLLGGNAFHEAILDCYDHINCGTYLDLLENVMPGSMIRQWDLINNPAKAKGLWREQQQWYESNKPKPRLQPS